MKKRKNSKKILFLSRLYYPHIGGVEKHLLKISSLLVKEGFSVTIICEQHDKKLKLKEEIDSITIIRIPILSSEKKKKFEIWKWMINNRKFIKEFDVIHIHDVFFWIIPLLFSIERKKVFITFHGYEGYPTKFASKVQKKMASKYCSGSISVGDFINKWYGLASNAVIYGGVDRPKTAQNLKKTEGSALFFGRLEQQTGIKEYYEAFLKLNKLKSFKFNVIGNGTYGNYMTKISISQFKSDVSGDIRDSRFIFVSGYLSMLEAMVEKRLVFAVYSDPLKKDYLLLSPFAKNTEICSSTNEIVERVNYYLNNPKKEKEKVENAYRWAKDQTWEKVVNTYKNIWTI